MSVVYNDNRELLSSGQLELTGKNAVTFVECFSTMVFSAIPSERTHQQSLHGTAHVRNHHHRSERPWWDRETQHRLLEAPRYLIRGRSCVIVWLHHPPLFSVSSAS